MKRHRRGIRFFLAAALLLCSLNISQAASGLAAYWGFNEGTGDTAYDGSGNGNNGVITGASWTSGIIGTALQFGGNSLVSVPDNSSLDPATVTVEAWVYSDSFTASTYGVIVSKDYANSASYRLQLYNATGTIEFVTSNTWDNEVTGATVLANHQWHQVVGEWANDSLKVYVDGKLDGAALRSGTISYGSNSLAIGATTSSSAPFNGKIDEVKIFNYELSADSVQAHFASIGLGIPSLSSPTNGAINQTTSPTFDWSAVSGATSYGLELSSSRSFSSTLFYQSSLAVTTQQSGNLLSGTTYYWRADAANATATGPWSPGWSFTTVLAAPAAPVLAAPTNGALNQPLASTLSWSASSGAASYSLQVSTGLSFLSTVASLTGITAKSAIVGGLSPGTVYYWQASAANSGGTSAWSTAWYFTTIPPPPAPPSLSAPSNNVANQPTSLTLTWNSSAGATSYSIQVSMVSSFATLLANWTAVTGLTQPLLGIANGTTFYWHVSASSGSGTSAWSATWSFGTIPATPSAPTLSAPQNGAAGQPSALTLIWSSVGGTVTSYAVQVSTAATFTSTVFAQSGTGQTAAVTGLSYGGALYYWRANAANIAGATWSGTWSFSTLVVPAAPALVSPTNDAVFTTHATMPFTLSWETVSTATSYTLLVSSAFTFGSTVFSAGGLTTAAQFTPTHGYPYYWQVRANNAAGVSPWSSVWALTPSVATVASSGQTRSYSFAIKQGALCYSLPKGEQVELTLYDLLGRRAMNFRGMQAAGFYSVDLKNSLLAAGSYIVHFHAGMLERQTMLVLSR